MTLRSGLALLAAILGVAGLVWLGLWQVERQAWKLALIERVETRAHAVPVPLPGDWSAPDAARDEYLHVTLAGRFRHADETLVQAVTDHGAGYWVLTPLETDGRMVLVNRGFVPPEARDPATRAAGQIPGEVTVTGLLRMSEPGGGFLRANDPTAGRWYSRDTVAIAAVRGLDPVAPWFVDADATPNPGGLPIGGLTVIAFHNNHLVYALTWFALAFGLGWATVYVIRERIRPAGG